MLTDFVVDRKYSLVKHKMFLDIQGLFAYKNTGIDGLGFYLPEKGPSQTFLLMVDHNRYFCQKHWTPTMQYLSLEKLSFNN